MAEKIPTSLKELASQYNTLYYLHIPKTAGTYLFEISFRHVLAEHHNPEDKLAVWIRKNYYLYKKLGILSSLITFYSMFNKKKVYYMPHPTCTSRPLDIGGYDRAWGKTCFHDPHFINSLVFTIVRNPFDLLVSMYTYGFPYTIPNSENKENHSDYPIKSFEEFVRAYCDSDYPWIVKYQQNFLFFQLFDDEGNCCVHLALRNECINEGLKILGKPFGIRPFYSKKRVRSSRDASQRDYKQFYTNELRKLVEKKCQRELKAFGYSFEGYDGRIIIDPGNIIYNPHTDVFKIKE
jgi:hypothetical protein